MVYGSEVCTLPFHLLIISTDFIQFFISGIFIPYWVDRRGYRKRIKPEDFEKIIPGTPFVGGLNPQSIRNYLEIHYEWTGKPPGETRKRTKKPAAPTGAAEEIHVPIPQNSDGEYVDEEEEEDLDISSFKVTGIDNDA